MLIVPALAQAEESGDEGFERNASFGLSYERRVTKRFGVGGLVEYTNGREWMYAVPFSWRITEPWKVMVAPGWEHEDGENT